jgi:EAL domain-containing protein (putative c-di-GMP-specific phosphodiesterase class I)
MQDVESTAAVLQDLKSMGVLLAIDDLGTGYSSLTYLRRFPIDSLKIDQSFVRDTTNDPDDAAIGSAVISMGRSLRQRVIAEGVETREQLAFLKTHSCDEGQGYYFGRPVGAEEFAEQLGAALRPPFASRQVSAVSAR